VGERCSEAPIEEEESPDEIPPQIISVEGGLFSLSSIEGNNSFSGRTRLIVMCKLAAFRALTVIRQ